MTYNEKLALARICYKKISQAIEECEALGEIQCCWYECIGVDDELFHRYQLIEKEEAQEFMESVLYLKLLNKISSGENDQIL